MKKGVFSREHYVQTWGSILSSYQWWGHDLRHLLKQIKETHPVVPEAFSKMYKEQDGVYSSQTFDSITRFYQKLSSLIPTAENLYTKLEVKALRKQNDNISIKETTMLKRFDYVIALLCFMEEFAFLSLNDKNISSTKNILTAHSENIDIFIERDRRRGRTVVRITIPCELCIEYNCSVKPLKWKSFTMLICYFVTLSVLAGRVFVVNNYFMNIILVFGNIIN